MNATYYFRIPQRVEKGVCADTLLNATPLFANQGKQILLHIVSSLFLLDCSVFHENGSFIVHSFNQHYLSIPQRS